MTENNKVVGKKELVDLMHEEFGKEKTKSEIKEFLTAFDNVIVATLEDHRAIKVGSLGTMSVQFKEERLARNPQTGEEITVPAKFVPKFKISKPIKDIVKNA